MKKSLLLTFALVSISFIAKLNAQCFPNSSGGTMLTNPSGLTMGQSFTATCNGVIDSLELFSDITGSTSGGTLNIYLGNSTTGSVYNQTFSAMSVVAGGPIRIVLTTPFAVTNATQYTFEFYITVPFRGQLSDVYAGGSAWQEGANYPSAELDFTVYISSTASVYETDFSKGIKLYPNPSMDIVTVDVGKNVTTGTLDLYSAEGKLVKSELITGQEMKLDMSKLAKGIYFVKIISEKNTAVIRVVHE